MSDAPRAKVAVQLANDQRADAAAVAVLRALLEVIAGNRDGALAAQDPEFLHQLRIAVRRSRTVQRQLRGVFPPLLLPGYRSEFRWLAQATSEARDLDVCLEGFGDLRALLPENLRDDLEPLHMVLGHWRLAAHGEVGRTLLSPRLRDLSADWEMMLETLVELPVDERPDAQTPIGELVGRRIRRVYERLIEMGKALDASSPSAELHEQRKKGKELRYLLELFGEQLFAEEVVGPLISTLKGVQDALGRRQDCEVQAAMLRSLADEVAALPQGPQAVLAMGVLLDHLAEEERAARREFADGFAALAGGEQRARVSETFG